MSNEVELMIREGIPEDAKELLYMMIQVGKETEFLVIDEKGLKLSSKALALEIDNIKNSINNLLLVAVLGNKIIGSVSVTADQQYRISHVGEVGISILKDFWVMGLGSMMMEELLFWVKENVD